jgi:hypothetical protein
MKEKNDERIFQLNGEIQVSLDVTHHFEKMLEIQNQEHVQLL